MDKSCTWGWSCYASMVVMVTGIKELDRGFAGMSIYIEDTYRSTWPENISYDYICFHQSLHCHANTPTCLWFFAGCHLSLPFTFILQ